MPAESPQPRRDGPAPILFVGGTGRSGTHVVAKLAARNSNYRLVPVETRFHTDADGFPGLLAGEVSKRVFIRRMRGFWWRGFQTDRLRGLYRFVPRERFDHALEVFDGRYDDEPEAACRQLFLDLLWPVTTEGRSGSALGIVEQSCDVIAQAPTLVRLFPEARFVHVVRDGRDASASRVSQRRWLVYPRTRRQGLEWWERRIRAIDAGAKAIEPGGLLELGLDDFLVRGARKNSVERLAAFAGVGAGARMRAFMRRRMNPARANRDRWRRGLEPAQQAAVERDYLEIVERLEHDGVSCAPILRRALERGVRRRVRARGLGMSGARRILFVTSNGTGLGHLTRSMAIARRLDGSLEPLFITFSAGAPVVRTQGFPIEYIASYDRPGAGTDLSWTFRARDRLRAAVEEIRPEVVVFDGTHPYERLLPALRATGAALVWCRRAMWRADADTAPLHRSHLFDAILEPGELDAGADHGPTARRRTEAHAVDPIVLLDRADLAGRAEAERELGLRPGMRNVLVQLGQGSGVREATARCVRHLAAMDGVQVAAPASHLEPLDDLPDDVVRLEPTYPIARWFAAFDAAVSAAGYNALHELMGLGVPALYVPIDRQTDDQAARAGAAEASGSGLAAGGPGDPALERRLDELLDPARHDELTAGLGRLGEWRGAEQAARWLEDLAARSARPASEPAGARPSASLGVRSAAGLDLRRERPADARARRIAAAVAAARADAGGGARPGRGAARAGAHARPRGGGRGAREDPGRDRPARVRAAARGRRGLRARSRGRRAPARAGGHPLRRVPRRPPGADPCPATAPESRDRAVLRPRGRLARPVSSAAMETGTKSGAGRADAAAAARGRAAEPDRDRRPEMRDQRAPLLPWAAPRDLDLGPQGAQLLHRGAQLAARGWTGTGGGSTQRARCGSMPRRTTRPTPSTRACPSGWPR